MTFADLASPGSLLDASPTYEDPVALLRFLGAEKAQVIGVSFGGKIALDFMFAHPEVITSLILVAPSIGGYPLVKGQTTLRIAYPTRQNTAFRYAVSGIAG